MIEGIDQVGRKDGHEENEHAQFLSNAFLKFVQVSGKVKNISWKCLRTIQSPNSFWHLLSHFGSKISRLMSVIPTNILSQDRLEKEASDLMDLALSGMIQAGDENIGHD